MQDGPDRTLTGDVVGTLRDMSPEQLEGQLVVDHRTDVYSLGTTLYELLALQPAFAERDRQPLMRQILEREPTPLRHIESSLPADLETIVARAMTKERELRYQSASELADDLQRFLDHRSILSRRAGRLERLWRWYKRSPLVAAMSAVILLLALVVAASAIFIAQRESTGRHVAEQVADEARWQQYLSDMHSAMAAWEQSNVGRTLELLERHRPGARRARPARFRVELSLAAVSRQPAEVDHQRDFLCVERVFLPRWEIVSDRQPRRSGTSLGCDEWLADSRIQRPSSGGRHSSRFFSRRSHLGIG